LPSGFEDGGGGAGGLDGGELLVWAGDEVGDALVSVAGLSGEAALGIGSVAEEERVGALVAGGVTGKVVSPVGLVDADFAFVVEGEEALLGMNFCRGGDPGRGVDGGGFGARVVEPIDHEGDGIFGGEVEGFSHAVGGRGGDADGTGAAFESPAMEVDVMGVEVVGNVGGLAGPGAKTFELGLGLAHVAGEVGGIAELAEPLSGVGVDGIPAFVNFGGDGDTVLVGDFDESIVFRESLHNGFGNEHMQAFGSGGVGHLEVEVIGREDHDRVVG